MSHDANAQSNWLPEEISASGALMSLYFSPEGDEVEKMKQDIDKIVRFTGKNLPLYYKGDFRIVGVQRLFDKSLAYRVVKIDPEWNDTFGAPARPTEIVIL